MLLWTLKRINQIPNYHNEFDKSRLFESTLIRPRSPGTITKFMGDHYTPQSNELFNLEFSKAETWFWRAKADDLLSIQSHMNIIKCEDSEMQYTNIDSDLHRVIKRLPKAIIHAANLAKNKGVITDISDDDFGVKISDKIIPYRELNDDLKEDMRDFSSFRLFAFCWLSGASEWNDNIDDIKTGNPIMSLWDVE